MNEQTYREHLNDLQVEIEELLAKLKEAQTGDTISRQAALTALASTAGVGNRALDKIRALPSAQPDVPDICAGDVVSRQWLMECVNEGWIKFDTEKDENRFIHLVRDIAPSAQPEIILCKDCNSADFAGCSGAVCYCMEHGAYMFQ